MRNSFDEQLNLLKEKLMEMGGLCESIIARTAKVLLGEEELVSEEIMTVGHSIDQMEREIESICLKLLLKQQPVARDLRQISAALKMITDMERIGDQAEDIAEICGYLGGRTGKECHDIKEMALATIKMVNDSVEAYVNQDLTKAQQVAVEDDRVDSYFDSVKSSLIKMIRENPADAQFALDLLMIAKYFERIGDHAVNIGEWVEFSLTGAHKEK